MSERRKLPKLGPGRVLVHFGFEKSTSGNVIDIFSFAGGGGLRPPLATPVCQLQTVSIYLVSAPALHWETEARGLPSRPPDSLCQPYIITLAMGHSCDRLMLIHADRVHPRLYVFAAGR